VKCTLAQTSTPRRQIQSGEKRSWWTKLSLAGFRLFQSSDDVDVVRKEVGPLRWMPGIFGETVQSVSCSQYRLICYSVYHVLQTSESSV
jgi:hypothetical protein